MKTINIALTLGLAIALISCAQDEPKVDEGPKAGAAPAAQTTPKTAATPPAPKTQNPPQPAAGQAGGAQSPMAEAKQLYNIRCMTCHGASGKGDGPAAAALNPQPRDYSDKEWQKTVTDDEIRTAILEGGVAVGKSALMPANLDLKDKTEVLEAMVQIIRGFAQ